MYLVLIGFVMGWLGSVSLSKWQRKAKVSRFRQHFSEKELIEGLRIVGLRGASYRDYPIKARFDKNTVTVIKGGKFDA